MQKKLLTIGFIFAILSSNSFGQKFQPGYIITNSLDTVYGLIANNDYIENSISCQFKKSETSEILSYKPFDINSYRLTSGKFYVSKTVEIDSVTQKVFLEYLVKGKANFYYMRNARGDYYFIQKENDKLVALRSEDVSFYFDAVTMKWVMSKDKSNERISQSKKYVGTIKYILRDAPQLYSEIDKTQLDHKSLIKVAQDYQHLVCKDEQCTVYEKSTKAYFGIAFTDKLNSIKYSGKLSGTTEFSKNIYNSLGITLICQLPTWNERINFKPSLIYDRFKFNNTDVDVFSYYSGYNISIPLAFQYNFIARKKISIYFNLGPEIDLTSVKLDSAGIYNNGIFVPVNGTSSYADYNTMWYKGIYLCGTSSLGLYCKLTKKIFLDIAANYSIGTKFGSIYRNSMGAMISLGYLFKEK